MIFSSINIWSVCLLYTFMCLDGWGRSQHFSSVKYSWAENVQESLSTPRALLECFELLYHLAAPYYMLKTEMKLTNLPPQVIHPVGIFQAHLLCSLAKFLCIGSAVLPFLSIKSATVSPASSSPSHQRTDAYVPTMIYIVSWFYLLFHLHPFS